MADIPTDDELYIPGGDDLAAGLSSTPARSGSPLAFALRRIPETAFHDFSQYVFLGDPHGLGEDDELADIDEGVVYSYLQFVNGFEEFLYGMVAVNVPERLLFAYGAFNRHDGSHPSFTDQALSVHWHQMFETYLSVGCYARYQNLGLDNRWIEACERALESWLVEAIDDSTYYSGENVEEISSIEFWLTLGGGFLELAQNIYIKLRGPSVTTDTEAYAFRPFPAPSVNFGLRLVYRQTWAPLGTQPGEIVRTLPLGPKQAEKVSMSFSRRTQDTRTTEVGKVQETTSETAETTKDSSEVVKEAQKSFKWNVEAEASASYGAGSGKLTAGMGGDNASSSKETKSRLNETMEKTSSRMRSESKVIVSTQAEDTFKQDQSSEISNPNEEIAVTYVYSRLQRQYEIATRLAELNTVIFVAEPIPRPDDINAKWIKQHDWILADALLDETFRDDLAIVRSHVPPSSTDADVDPRIDDLMATLSGIEGGPAGGIPSHAGMPGGQIPDLYRAQQETYEREVERRRARTRQDAGYAARLDRLVLHLKDNILHYCRAIWSSEDPERRTMRFRDIRVPMRWLFRATGVAGADEIVPGYYEPAVSDWDNDTAPLSEILNPAGPIGFAGNYAVYYIKPSQRWESLNQALLQLRAPYLRFEFLITNPDGQGAAQIAQVALHPDRVTTGRYQIVYDGADIWVFREFAPGSWDQVTPGIQFASGMIVEVDGLRFSIEDTNGNLAAGDEFYISVLATPFLEDPELKVLRWMNPMPDSADEQAFFTKEVIQDMASVMPQVAQGLDDELALDPSWGELSSRTRALIRALFHNYLLAREHTRRFLLETNNLLLDLEIGTTPSLEDFKRLHRYIDVLKAFEEREKVRLDNVRRRYLMKDERFEDPDIDKVMVVSGIDDMVPLSVLGT